MKAWRKAGSTGTPARRSDVYKKVRKRLFHVWLRVCLALTFALRARTPALPVATHTTCTNLAPLSPTNYIEKHTYVIDES